MKIKKHLFIVNLFSGKGTGKKHAKEVEKLFSLIKKENDSIEYEIVYSKFEGHATKIAQEYTSKDDYIVYAVGGDGTINEVLNGMAGTNSILACIPAGTGNDFMRTVTDIKNVNIIKDTILGDIVDVDLCSFNGKYFMNNLSIGFDSEINVRADRYKKSPILPNRLAYIFGGVSAFRDISNYELKVEIDGETSNLDILLFSVSNGKSYGGGIKMAPHAEINDGLLEIVYVEAMGRVGILSKIPSLMAGTHLEEDSIHYRRAKKVKITSDKELILNVDGIAMAEREIDIEIHHKALKFLVPKGNSLLK